MTNQDAPNHPAIEAVVFDMDGLMFNTEDLYDQVGDILLGRRGQEYTRALKLEMMGRPGPEAFMIMKTRCKLTDSVKELQSETDEIFQTLLPERIEKMPGLDGLLEWIESRGLPKAVATSSHRQFAKRALGFFDLEPRFQFILTGDDVENGKPSPDIYLAAAEQLKTSPNNILVLEDSFIGSTAAKAAGTFTVAVPTEHSLEADFSHVDYVARSLEDEFIFELLR